jgi:hypothetical protein
MNMPIIEQLKKTEDRLRRKIEEMKGPLAQAEEDLRNIAGTIAFYQRTAQGENVAAVRGTTVAITTGIVGAPNLRTMTHKQAVVAIAKHNGGTIKAQEAKQLMIQAGIMRATKNSTRMVHNAIISSDRFDRIAPGEYRLKIAVPPSGNSAAALAANLFTTAKPPFQ